MPRIETRYFCNVCNSVYSEEEKAIQCEKAHLIPISVSDADYLKSDNKKLYPDSVLIHFEGGKSARYYRKKPF